MILKNLLRRKTRSVLTILGVALGIAAIVALTAIGAGLANSYGNLFATSDADLTLSQADAIDLFLSSLDEDIGDQVAMMPQVQAVAGIIYSGVRMEGIPFFLVFGYDPQEYAISHYKVVEGRTLLRDREIIIGRGASRNLSKSVGDSLQFFDNTFRIVGIYETGAAFEEAGGVITLKDAQMIFQKPRQVSLFQVKLRDPRQAERVRQRITARFPDVLVSLGTGAGERREMYDLVEAFALGIGLIAALVGGMGMMNTVMMSVFERTREIGVLRALGWRRGRILGMILGESLILSLVGGLLGMALGILLVRLAALDPAISSMIVSEFSLRLFVQAGIIALTLGAVAGVYPAWRAAQLQPVEALRYEGGAFERETREDKEPVRKVLWPVPDRGRGHGLSSGPDSGPEGLQPRREGQPSEPEGSPSRRPVRRGTGPSSSGRLNVGRQGWRLPLPVLALPPALRNLARRRMRTFLTVAGITIGVTVVVALGAVTEGFIDQFTALLSGGGADLAAMQARVADMSLSAIDEQAGRRVATMPDVAEVSGMVVGFVSTPEMPLLLVFGLEPTEFTIRQFAVVEGRSIQGRGETIIGRPAADSLHKRLGDLVRIAGRPFRIVGIYETGVGYQDAGAVIDRREAQALFDKPRQVSFYQIKLKNPDRAEQVIQEIERRFPQITVSRSAEFLENTEDIKLTRAMVAVLSSIAVIVGSVGVMNTMLMSVFERTREIGVLRAMGWRRRRVLEQILSESLVLGAVGGAMGIILGIGLVLLLGRLPAVGGLLRGSFKPIIFVQGALVALGLGAVGGIYPAWRATQFQPAEALRYE